MDSCSQQERPCSKLQELWRGLEYAEPQQLTHFLAGSLA